MRGQKFISALCAAAMMGSATGLNAFAENNNAPAPVKKTYNYVALGDSIAAGYGLGKENGLAGDPALVITDKLLANPVQGAYPAILSGKLKELGANYGADVQGTNLASTAYRAADIEKTIRQPGYKGEFAASILESFAGEGTSEVLAPYHDLYLKYLSQADLVSIQLGGNDIVMSIIPEMLEHENPVIRASAMSLMLTLFGTDTETAMGAGLQIIEQSKDSITADTFLEAANYLKNIGAKSEELVQQSADHVKCVVKAVQEVNGETDIALVGMFNPYRTAEGSADVEKDILDVLGPIFAEASDAAAETEELTDAKGEPTEEFTETLNDKVAKVTELKEAFSKLYDYGHMAKVIDTLDSCETLGELKKSIMDLGLEDAETLEAILKQYTDIDELRGILAVIKSGEDVSELPDVAEVVGQFSNSAAPAEAKAFAKEIAGPAAMQLAGKNVDPQIKSLNEKLKVIAKETGALYVDVYNISPETDFDPHPNANGHQEIADIVFASVKDLAAGRMSDDKKVSDVEETPDKKERSLGDVNGDGDIDTTDVTLVAAHVKGKKILDPKDAVYADVDRNGKINITDIIIIAAHVKGKRLITR
ncbi:dockerin type I domain-containing protein [Ruminococcus albus]|uniref:GDSL-like Lipase/Acylhydrolase n=1 Tax=Ruminococcus albus TaxID=1264 RepID=A0A1H7FNR6_RUMAL|nr:dockerin type I domain-containing protein [Ruminococcus albus]SEK27726.1 GDSL-like Lipase/Acylhydrolase [Ruminococcus albus]